MVQSRYRQEEGLGAGQAKLKGIKKHNMGVPIQKQLAVLVLIASLLSCKDQSPNAIKDGTHPTDHHLVVDLKDTGIKIQPTMYGIFFEDINFAADGGLYAEMIKNRSFEFTLPKIGWLEPNSDRHSFNEESGIMSVIKYGGEGTNHNFARIEVKN